MRMGMLSLIGVKTAWLTLVASQIPCPSRDRRLGHAGQLEARLFKHSKHCTRVLCAPLAFLDEASSYDVAGLSKSFF